MERLGHAEGPINLARVRHREGDLQSASEALERAAALDPDTTPWVRAWLGTLVKRDLGDLDGAILDLRALTATRFTEPRRRGFDFSGDYRLQNELARTLYKRARRIPRGEDAAIQREALLAEARAALEAALALHPEYAPAHHNLARILPALGETDAAFERLALRRQYRPDDAIAALAVSRHRAFSPAADHAADPGAVYDLQRPEAFGLTSAPP